MLLADWGIVGLSACESTLSGTGHTKIVKSDTNSAIIRIYGTDYKAEFKTSYTLADVH